MRKRLIASLLLLLVVRVLFSQSIIKGKVVSATNSSPIPGCSVFINTTSKGTFTDKDGNFELMDVPHGRHELVISNVGFETLVYPFSDDQLPLQLNVQLKVRIKELENVIVEPFEEEGWDKWGRLFTDNFVGNTPNAVHCTIKNKQAIKFRYYRKSNRVIAYADEPLVFENRALGYQISYDLEQFEVNFTTNVTVFFGYPFFQDIQTKNKNRRARWKQNRDKAYYGSMMHFFRSLYKDSLAQQGFEVRRMVRVPNLEKQRVKQIYKLAHHPKAQPRPGEVYADLKNIAPDSLQYYEQVLRQRDYKDVYGEDPLNSDSLIVSTTGAFKLIYFPDYLFVTYKKELEDKDYLSFTGQNRKPSFQQSYITMPGTEPVEIDMNGNYPPQDILALAYWGWSEKMADFLPLDYEP